MRFPITLAMCALLAGKASAQMIASPAQAFRSEARQTLQRMSLTVAAMPPGQFGLRPTPPQRSFAALVADLVNRNQQLCAQLGSVDTDEFVSQSTASRETLSAQLDRTIAFCNVALDSVMDSRLWDTVYVRTRGQDGPIRPKSRMLAMIEATAYWSGMDAQLAQYVRLAGRVPPIPCSGPSGENNCDNSVNRCVDPRPGVSGRQFTLSDAPYSVRSDGRGPYRRRSANVGVVYLARIAVLNLMDFAFDSQTARSIQVDLSRPVDGGSGRPLGIIVDDHGVEVSAQWGRDSAFTARSLLDIPVDSTVLAAQMEVGFHIDGVYHALQFGPQPWGHCFSDGTAVHGAGTSRGTIRRISESAWEIELPQGSIGRLFDISRSAPNAVDKGLYYASMHFIIER
jgi:hypothetical protein